MAGGLWAAVIGYIFTYYNAQVAEQRKARIDRVNQQLRDLYGPLLACVTATKTAYEAMMAQHSPDGSRAGFQAAMQARPDGPEARAYRQWMTSVLQPLNEKAAGIVQGGFSLLEGGSPKMEAQLLQLVAHVSACRVVLQRWAQGELGTSSAISYPDKLEGLVRKEFARVKARQAELLGVSRITAPPPHHYHGGGYHGHHNHGHPQVHPEADKPKDKAKTKDKHKGSDKGSTSSGVKPATGSVALNDTVATHRQGSSLGSGLSLSLSKMHPYPKEEDGRGQDGWWEEDDLELGVRVGVPHVQVKDWKQREREQERELKGPEAGATAAVAGSAVAAVASPTGTAVGGSGGSGSGGGGGGGREMPVPPMPLPPLAIRPASKLALRSRL